MKLLQFAALLSAIYLMAGCSAQKQVNRKLGEMELRNKYHLGVSVVDFESGKKLVGWQDARYFNPASNTKIYTLYAAMRVVGDSLPGLQYRVAGDSLLFQGTGDPSFLHPDLPVSNAYLFLKNAPQKLVYYAGEGSDTRFGPGWAWDDYTGYYQAEKSVFPIYGNVARFTGDSSSVLRADPPFWYPSLVGGAEKPGIEREEFTNTFHFKGRPLPPGLRQDIPVITSDRLTVSLLNASLGKEVESRPGVLSGEVRVVNSIPADTAFKLMMYESDNLLAEHLMYAYAVKNNLRLHVGEAIRHAIEHHLRQMPDSLVWRDGSGLSRYNLFTPRSTTEVLSRMLREFPENRVLALFPQAGKQGTVKHFLRSRPLRIYAKSGSFSNNYNLSGYLYSKKGKLLVFSVMNNNYAGPIRDLQRLTEAILEEIYEAF